MYQDEIDLQSEVDRKALAALTDVLDSVDSGAVTPDAGRRFLAVLQTAFNGIVEDSEFFELLTEADKSLEQYPKTSAPLIISYYKTTDTSRPPDYIIRYQNCHLKISSKGRLIKERKFELPHECFQAVLSAHKKFTEKGLFNA